jgi:hypothetical protein
MTSFLYYVTADVFLAIFCIVFLGISYLEAETVRITVSIKKGDLKLRHSRIPVIKEYQNIIKPWAPVTLAMAFGLTSFVFALKETPYVRYFVLLALFMYATAVMTFGSSVFLSELTKEKAMRAQIVLNSLYIWLVTIVTAVVSGYLAAFFRISPFEDLVVAILPLLIAELFRLGFLRNTVFSLRFSDVEQASRFLSLAANQYSSSDPFTHKLSEMRRRVDEFLTKLIVLELQQSQILSDLKSKKEDIFEETEELIRILPTLQLTSDLQVHVKENETLITHGPFYVKNNAFYAICYKSGDTITGFSVFKPESKSFISDMETVKKIAVCIGLLLAMNNYRMQRIRIAIKTYFARLTMFLMDILRGFFRWSFVSDTSRWVSRFDDFERAKQEGLIGLDMTALLDYFARRNVSYLDLSLPDFERAFLRLHSYAAASSIVELNKEKLVLYEELLRIWEQRTEAAKIVPAEVIGTRYVRRSSARVKEMIASKHQALQRWANSLEKEIQKLSDLVRM